MHPRLIPLSAVTDADVRAWQRLADAAAEPNAFLDPRFLVPARHAGRGAADVRLVVVQEAEEWLAVLAVTTKSVAPGVPLRATTTGGAFLTTYSDRHHPLVRTGRETEALEALLRAVPAVGLPALVQLQHFPAEGVLADSLAEVLARSRMLVHERRRAVSAFAARRTVPDAPVCAPSTLGRVLDLPLVVDHLGAGRRKDLRRRIRALERAAGGPLLLEDVSADPATDDDFITLQASGWKGDLAAGGAALGLDPSAQRWFRSLLDGFRRTGDLLALRLVAGGRTQWMGYTLRSGRACFGFLDAYCEQHRHLSPGAVGRLAELTHVLASTDARYLDPAFDARYAVGAQTYPDARTHVDLLVATRGMVAHSAVRAMPVARRLGFRAQVLALPLAPEYGEPLEQVLLLLGA
ncbi:MAG TPA: GNAT family N-acetyltransferase [Cellulomonas sp.]